MRSAELRHGGLRGYAWRDSVPKIPVWRMKIETDPSPVEQLAGYKRFVIFDEVSENMEPLLSRARQRLSQAEYEFALDLVVDANWYDSREHAHRAAKVNPRKKKEKKERQKSARKSAEYEVRGENWIISVQGDPVHWSWHLKFFDPPPPLEVLAGGRGRGDFRFSISGHSTLDALLTRAQDQIEQGVTSPIPTGSGLLVLRPADVKECRHLIQQIRQDLGGRALKKVPSTRLKVKKDAKNLVRRNGGTPAELYAKLSNLVASPTASEGERQNARATMRRMEEKYEPSDLRPPMGADALAEQIVKLSEFCEVTWDGREYVFEVSSEGNAIGRAISRMPIEKIRKLQGYIDYGQERPLHDALRRAVGAPESASYRDLMWTYSRGDF